MSTPYVGEIRIFAGNFAPAGWEFCDGRLLAISENETLFQLIGTTYGGDGQVTFAMPDLRGRLPIHQGSNSGSTYLQGETGGVETVTLTAQQIPAHSHALLISANATNSRNPAGNVLGAPLTTPFFPEAPNLSLAAQAISSTGGNQPHTNVQPYLCLNFIISLYGIFPFPT